MKKWLVFFLFLAGISLFFSGCLSPTIPSPSTKASDWTLLIFMNGDNDLENDAWQDLNSMEMVGSTERVNIIVQMDTPKTGAYRYRVTQDEDPSLVTSPILESLGRVDMGDYRSLIDFVRFGVQNYPASRYALILWNHGGGFRKRDISFDFSTGHAITIPQLAYALSQTKSIIGKNLDLLGMDACLMAMVEVAYEVRNYANVMVASEEFVPGEGWDYAGFLQILVHSPSMGERELARAIIDTYVDSYLRVGVTQSAIDLKAVATLAQSLDTLAQAVLGDSRTPPNLYLYLGDQALYFGDYDFVDLGSLLGLWHGWPTIQDLTVREKAGLARDALAQTVFYERNNLGKSLGGLSVYFPYQSYDPKYDTLSFASSTSWDDMLKYLFRYR
ncbi:MAG: clostripain-related cysteine peptidase [Atribacterota bacterium]